MSNSKTIMTADLPAEDRGGTAYCATRITRKKKWLAVLIVIAVAVLTWSFRWGGPIDLRYDAGVYYTLGTSLATGEGYRILAEPGAPEGIQYPPGLPALVAMHQWVLGTHDPAIVGVWIKRTYAVLFAMFSIATLVLACTCAGLFWGTLATVFCLLQLNTYFLSNLLFAELPFTLVSVCLALTLASERLRSHAIIFEVTGFVFAAIGFFLRTAGLALLVAWAVEAFLRKQWRWGVARVILGALPFLAWHIHVNEVQRSDAYHNPAYAYQRAPYQFYNVSYAENLKLVDPFQPELGRATLRTLAMRLKANLAVLPLSLGEAASEARGFWSGAAKMVFYGGRKKVEWIENLTLLPIALIAILTFSGWIILLRRRVWFPAVLILCSIGLVCSTPWPEQFLRYLAPLTPFISITFILGFVAVAKAVHRIRRKPGRVVAWVMLTTIFTGVVGAHAFAFANSFQSMFRVRPPQAAGQNEAWNERRWFYYDRSWVDWERAVDWIGENAPKDMIVATSAPHFCYLTTGRHAVFPPMEADPAKAERLLSDVPVGYVIIDELAFLDISRRYAAPAVAHAPQTWELVQRFNKTTIFRKVSPRGR